MLQSTHLQNTPTRLLPSHASLLFFILALALVRGVIYAAAIPPWQAPDEPAQFERVKASLATADWNSTSGNPPGWYTELKDSLVTFQFAAYTLVRPKDTPEDSLESYIDLYHQLYGGTYGSRFSYALMGWPLLLTPQPEIVLQLYLIRLYTVLMGVAIMWLAYGITSTLFPGDRFLCWGVPILILFNPQHTQLLATVNNGNLAELLATAALFFIARTFYPGSTRLNLALAILFSLLAVWTKATAYFLFFSWAGAGLFFLYRYRSQWRWFLLVLGGAILGVYFLAPSRLSELARQAWSSLINRQFSLNPMVLADIFASFWAMPGWAILRLSPIWYQILLVMCSLALVGLVVFVVRQRRPLLAKPLSPAEHALLVFGISVGVAIAIQIGWHILTGSLVYRQGRSLYPVMVPLSIFLLAGWRQLIPPAWRRPGLLALTAALFLFDAVVLFTYITPFFYSRS